MSVPPFLPPLVEWATRDGRVFFKRRDISFSPIPRNQKGEASDTAIEAKLAQLAQSKRDTCMALLTCDNDFVEQVRQIAALRKNDMWVFVPVNGDASLHSSLRRYKETGAHAVPLATSVIQAERQRSGQRTKVRAILEPDGHGSVKMGQPGSNPVHGRAAVDQLRTFLQDLGYCDARAERGHLLQSVAKFWFVNRLGRLTAYPTQNAFDAACEVLQASNRQHSWARCRNDHAFFLPMTCGGSSTKTTLREYGGKTQKQVFEGGGPFMIKDSASMVAQALQRMGYLDEVYNSDLPEALLLFVNRWRHKSTLRRVLDELPVSSDTAVDVEHKLRQAFLSNLPSGKWVFAQKDFDVRRTLCKNGFLKTVEAPKPAVLHAMRRFVRRRGLRDMRTYNGFVYIIQRHLYRKDPDRVGNIEFKI